MLWLDTAGLWYMSEDDLDLESDPSCSKSNRGEQNVVTAYLRFLVSQVDVLPGNICVITPYNKQVQGIRRSLEEDAKLSQIEVATVDSFQGRESEVVVISLVRSNKRREIGFLADQRRLNVAVTRAKRLACVIGDSETISSDPVLESLFVYVSEYGEVRSAVEFSGEEDQTEGKVMQKGALADFERAACSNHGRKPNTVTKKEQRHPGKGAPKQVEHHCTKNIEEDDPRVVIFKAQLDEVLSSKKALKFPPTLTSFERMLVHRLAEEMGLHHTSQGEGTSRYIVVSVQQRVSAPQILEYSVLQSFVKDTVPALPNREKGKAPNRFEESLSSSSSDASSDNADQQDDEPFEAAAAPKSSSSSAHANRPVPKELSENSDDKMEDLKKFLAEMAAENSRCSEKGCTKSIKIMGQTCRHCRRKYCFEHAMAEIHGCGKAASDAAKAAFRLQSGSLTPDIWGPKDEWKRYYMADKLREQIRTAEAARKPKAKSKGKGKK
eukprot:GHVN01056641.1.p1 GENE.GHVN01056641.1~~GHVN01056641.1.p1  ORF type:complete len:494 (+),score=59.06 GHVN01056641.1:1464-2945(+)